MKAFFKRTSPIVFGSVLLALQTGCSGAADTGDGATGSNQTAVSVNEMLSLTPYLPAEAEGMSLTDQFDMEWAFEVQVKGNDEEKLEAISNCKDAIHAYERGQEPARPSEYQAYRQAVLTCYAVRLVASAGSGRIQPLRSFPLNEEWIAALPVELAPVTSTKERERILQSTKHQTWSDASQIVSVDDQDVGRAVVETPSGSQDINVLATGDLNKDGVEDTLVSVTTSMSEGSYAVTQLFLLTRRDNSDSLQVAKEY